MVWKTFVSQIVVLRAQGTREDPFVIFDKSLCSSLKRTGEGGNWRRRRSACQVPRFVAVWGAIVPDRIDEPFKIVFALFSRVMPGFNVD